MKSPASLRWLCLCLVTASLSAQTMVDDFEYASEELLRLSWIGGGGAPVTISENVAPRSTGTLSMRVDFSFGSGAWATETIRGVDLPSPLTIGSSQYVTFRLQGDPAFAGADFRNLYLYAYDAAGNFGRWGGPVPTTADWQVINYPANTIAKPWDSPALPDLNNIVKFAFFQYGSEAAIPAYTATIYIDDLMVRDTPLVEFPLPAAPRALIDDFEGYADNTALLAAYTYQNSPPTTTATSISLESPAPQGSKALKLAIDFAPGQYPWGSVRSAAVAPFSVASNAVVTLRLKGDPTFAALADSGTTFWLSFYDKAGNGINFSSPAEPVVSADWVTLEVPFSSFWSGAVVDTGNLVQWRILVEGWMGTPEQEAKSGTFYVDDIRITAPRPVLGAVVEGANLKLNFTNLEAGKAYNLLTTPDFASWTTNQVVNATNAAAEVTLTPAGAKGFFKLVGATP